MRTLIYISILLVLFGCKSSNLASFSNSQVVNSASGSQNSLNLESSTNKKQINLADSVAIQLQYWLNELEIAYPLDSLSLYYNSQENDTIIDFFGRKKQYKTDSSEINLFFKFNQLLSFDSIYVSDSIFILEFKLNDIPQQSYYWDFISDTNLEHLSIAEQEVLLEWYSLSLKVLFNSTIEKYPALLKVLVKSSFFLETSIESIKIRLYKKDLLETYIIWKDGIEVTGGVVNNSKSTSDPVLDLLSPRTGLERIMDKVLSGWDWVLAAHIDTKFSLPSNTSVKSNSELNKEIKWFLQEKYLGKAIFYSDNQLEIKKAQGLISGQTNIWENIEIFIFASIDNDIVSVNCILDGDWKEAAPFGSGPTQNALSEGGKLDKKFPKEIKSYGYNLLNDLKKYLNERR